LNLHLALLIVYSTGVLGLGIWTARFVRSSSAFFVAGRSLGPGLLLSSMLAANIGAGSTLGATGLAYRDGVSAWWWVGSAGIGSLIFGGIVAPRLWTLAKRHDFYTTGDYLEFRYGAVVRAVATALVGIGSLALLAGQLIAGAAILHVITGMPRWLGALTGGAIMTVYFTAGGLLGTAWVNTLQLIVMLGGFLIAVPTALHIAGGWDVLSSPNLPAGFADFSYSAGPGSGWTLLFLLGPAFIISPGLIQKAYGGRSAEAVRTGTLLNAFALLLFAFLPVLMGVIARATMPGITDPNTVLPTILTQGLPPWLGALALSAVFSTEVDTSDAILFMISTSASQDLYRRFMNPAASDRQLLLVGRSTAVAGGTVGVLLAIWLDTVIGAVTVFYSLLVVTMLVPVLGGLYVTRAGSREALAAIVTGVVVLFLTQFWLGRMFPWLDPALAGIVAAALAYCLVLVFRRKSDHV
jgi:SSS family solute:Na+ symporter